MRTAVPVLPDNFDEPTVRRLMESDVTFDARVWNRLGSELGVLGLSVPEADGGAGGSLVDQAVAVEEFGGAGLRPAVRHGVPGHPGPGGLPGGEARDALLGELVEAPAPPRSPSPIRPAPSMPTRWPWPPGRRPHRHGAPVIDAGAADELLVAAVGPTARACTPWTPAGWSPTHTVGHLDLTRPQANVEFSGAPARLLAGPDEAER